MRNQKEHVLVHRSQPFFWKRPESKYLRLPKSYKLCLTTQLCPGAQKQSWWRRNGHGRVPIKLPTEIGGGMNLALGLQRASPCARRVCIYLEVETETKLPQVTPESRFPRPGSPHAWPLSLRILTAALPGTVGSCQHYSSSSSSGHCVGRHLFFCLSDERGPLPPVWKHQEDRDTAWLFSGGPQPPAQDLASSESLLTK